MKTFENIFPKLATCTNGNFTSLMPHFLYREKVAGVYLILFPNGDKYVGVSGKLHKRIWQHYWGMRSGKHTLKQLIKAYRSNNETFNIFQLRSEGDGHIAGEEDFIFALKANLNKAFWDTHVHVNELRDIANIIGCDVMDFFRDEATHQPEPRAENTLACPKCGAKLKIVEE